MDEQNQDSFQYNPEEEIDDSTSSGQNQDEEQKPADKDRTVSWTGSEFIANHKGSKWFLSFFAVLVAVVGLIFALTKDYVSAISVAVVGVLFAFLANRQPRQLTYQIDNKGINMGSNFYAFDQFKSFSLAQDGAIGYINLMPMKRFMPDVSIYFPPEQEATIIEILSDHLPHNEGDERHIDKLAKRFRF
jgi:hypothetical protein